MLLERKWWAFSECLRATQWKFAYSPSEKLLLLFFASGETC